MQFFEDVSRTDRDKIDLAVTDIKRFGDGFHRRIATFLNLTNINLFVGPVSVVRGSGSVQFEDYKTAYQAVNSGKLDMDKAASYVQLNIARETIDTGGQRGIEGTLVHEGKHALDFAMMLHTASHGDAAQFFNPTAYQKEYSAHLTAAFYLKRRGGEYSEEGIRLGLVKCTDGHLAVDPEGIRKRLKNNYGLSPEAPGSTLDTASDPRIRPVRRKFFGLL